MAWRERHPGRARQQRQQRCERRQDVTMGLGEAERARVRVERCKCSCMLFGESMYLTNTQGMFLAALAAAALSWFDDMNEGKFARGAFGAAIALAVITVYQSNKQLRTLNRILLHPDASKMIMNQVGSHNTANPPVFYPSTLKRSIWQSAVFLHNVAFIAVAVGTVGTIYPDFLDNEKQRGVRLKLLTNGRSRLFT